MASVCVERVCLAAPCLEQSVVSSCDSHRLRSVQPPAQHSVARCWRSRSDTTSGRDSVPRATQAAAEPRVAMRKATLTIAKELVAISVNKGVLTRSATSRAFNSWRPVLSKSGKDLRFHCFMAALLASSRKLSEANDHGRQVAWFPLVAWYPSANNTCDCHRLRSVQPPAHIRRTSSQDASLGSVEMYFQDVNARPSKLNCPQA